MEKVKNEHPWIGTTPGYCDICSQPIKSVFIDGKTIYGAWGIMCPQCFPSEGTGLGTGRGQKYVRQAGTGKYMKVEG